jgi:hypothetical protein
MSPQKQQTYSIAVLALPPSQRFRVAAVGALLVLGVIGGRRILLLARLPRRACIGPVFGCPRRRFPPEGNMIFDGRHSIFVLDPISFILRETIYLMITTQYLYWIQYL